MHPHSHLHAALWRLVLRPCTHTLICMLLWLCCKHPHWQDVLLGPCCHCRMEWCEATPCVWTEMVVVCICQARAVCVCVCVCVCVSVCVCLLMCMCECVCVTCAWTEMVLACGLSGRACCWPHSWRAVCVWTRCRCPAWCPVCSCLSLWPNYSFTSTTTCSIMAQVCGYLTLSRELAHFTLISSQETAAG